MKDKYEIRYVIFRLIIKIIGQLSHEDLISRIGEDDAKILSEWYFKNRQEV